MSSKRYHLAQVLGERSLNVSNTKKLAQEIAAYLLETGQLPELDSLMRDIINYRTQKGVVEAKAVSANPLSARDIADIRDILKIEYPQAKQFQLDQDIDPGVLGGVKVDLPGEQLDLTIRAQVNKFKRLTTSGKGA